jgi:hypothetical protein
MLSRFDSHPAAYLARKLPYDIPLTLFMNTKLIREEETTSRSGEFGVYDYFLLAAMRRSSWDIFLARSSRSRWRTFCRSCRL